MGKLLNAFIGGQFFGWLIWVSLGLLISIDAYVDIVVFIGMMIVFLLIGIFTGLCLIPVFLLLIRRKERKDNKRLLNA